MYFYLVNSSFLQAESEFTSCALNAMGFKTALWIMCVHPSSVTNQLTAFKFLGECIFTASERGVLQVNMVFSFPRHQSLLVSAN